jgi:membrane glycosyltransferase
MEDELNKPQELQPIAFEDIPTPEEHKRETRRIFTIFGSIAATIVLTSVVTITVLLVRGVPPSAVAVFTMLTMNICVIAFGFGYGMPVGLVSLRRLEIAYRMGYFGIGQSRKATAAMETIATRVKRETAPLPRGQRPSVED